MAYYQGIFLLFLYFAFAGIEASQTIVIKGAVTCLDCDAHFDFSGIKVSVKCNKVKKQVIATTTKDGSFETVLRHETPNTSPWTASPKCFAKIIGGPSLLYTTSKNTASNVVKIKGQQDFYTNLDPLSFYKSCPSNKYSKCADIVDSEFGSSKTVDLPVPKEWGLAPTSYYFPFIPIIGIP